jgi:hypothetical protein
VDILEAPNNFQAYREVTLSHAPLDNSEFDALSAEDQTSWCYFAARSAAASGAKIAADKGDVARPLLHRQGRGGPAEAFAPT